jgi:hypothetical protein
MRSFCPARLNKGELMRFVDHANANASLIIDDNGKIWHQSSPELRQQLLCPNYPGNLENDVIRNLGYIGLRLSNRSVSVKYRPNTVSEVALTAALFWLGEHQPSNVCLRFIEYPRPDEIVGNYSSAIERIAAMQLEVEMQKRVSAVHRDVREIHAESPLFPILQYWMAVAGQCSTSELRRLAMHYAKARYAFVCNDAIEGYIFTELGDGLVMPDLNTIRATQERPLSQQVDTLYYKWVTRNYSDALESFRPDLADVDVHVSWPRHRPVRHRYRRLLLPCRGRKGQFLFSASSTEFFERSGLPLVV